jgi:hypothetical protein
MKPMKKSLKKKPGLYILLMFAGILTGIVVLTSKIVKTPHTGTLRKTEFSMPDIRKTGISSAWEKLSALADMKIRLTDLMRRDSLSSSDSLEIKEIDRQLNQMLRD